MNTPLFPSKSRKKDDISSSTKRRFQPQAPPVPAKSNPRDRGRSFPGLISEWISIQSNVLVDTSTASKITLVDFEDFRQTVRDTETLPQGWDSGSAGPISGEAIKHAISLLNALEAARILPSRVIPTCDDSISIRYPIHDQTIECEFFSEGNNVRVQIEPTVEKSYLEVSAEQISQHI